MEQCDLEDPPFDNQWVENTKKKCVEYYQKHQKELYVAVPIGSAKLSTPKCKHQPGCMPPSETQWVEYTKKNSVEHHHQPHQRDCLLLSPPALPSGHHQNASISKVARGFVFMPLLHVHCTLQASPNWHSICILLQNNGLSLTSIVKSPLESYHPTWSQFNSHQKTKSLIPTIWGMNKVRPNQLDSLMSHVVKDTHSTGMDKNLIYLVVLLCNNGSHSHAVAIVDGWVFDPNLPLATRCTKGNLNRLCSDDGGFCHFYQCLKFTRQTNDGWKNKPKPQIAQKKQMKKKRKRTD